MAGLYGPVNNTVIQRHKDAAANLKAGILDLFWDSQKVCGIQISFCHFIGIKADLHHQMYK